MVERRQRFGDAPIVGDEVLVRQGDVEIDPYRARPSSPDRRGPEIAFLHGTSGRRPGLLVYGSKRRAVGVIRSVEALSRGFVGR